MTTLRETLQATSTFLSASIATETSLPLVQRLYSTIPSSWTPSKDHLSKQAGVVLYGLDLLKMIYEAAITENSQLGIKDWRQVNAVVEIILVLGLYKILSPGVGIPESRRVKSVMLAREGLRNSISVDERQFLLQSIVSIMKETMERGGELGETLQRKHVVDILSGMAELAYNPSYPESERLQWKSQYNTFLSKYSPHIPC
jgi:hypothetical protein